MKYSCLFLLAATLWAQTAPPPPSAQKSLPDLPAATEIAEFSDGSKVTMADVKASYGTLSPTQQQGILRDPSEFIKQWAVLRHLSQIALERKLDGQNPYKQALEQNRMNVLSQAAINDTLNSFVIESADIAKYYETSR